MLLDNSNWFIDPTNNISYCLAFHTDEPVIVIAVARVARRVAAALDRHKGLHGSASTYIPQVGRAIWRELLTHCWRAKRIGRNAKQVDDLVLKVG